MEFWGAEVKSGEPLEVYPGDGFILHLSQACLGEVKKNIGNESVCLFVKVDKQKLVLGTLSSENFPQLSFDLVFEKKFELSHNWKNGSVYFTGYKACPPKQGEVSVRRRPQVELEEFSFLEKIFAKTTPEERTWAKLVNLDTLHWYCDGPEPTPEAVKYDARIRQQMDAAKRKAMIKEQAAKKKEVGDVDPMGTGSSNPSTKRKQPSKGDRPPKKPKVPLEPVVGLMAEGAKAVTPAKHGAGKGFMRAPSTSKEKPPVLIREDSKYALEKLTSIITTEDYEDLGNHSTEAMGETGLFNIAQAMLMMRGLMGRCLTHETALERVQAKANLTEDELNQLRAWKENMVKKFDHSEGVRKELEQGTEKLKKVLGKRDKEIKELKDQLRRAKEEAIREYRDSDALLSELGTSFVEGFDDALRQVQKAYPDVDISIIKIEEEG